MRVAKWGNSLAVRIPAELVEEMGLKEGDEIEFERTGSNAITLKAPVPFETRLDWLAQNGGQFPAGFKFDRQKMYEDEGR